MATSPDTYLTVRQHADGLAREFYKDSWRGCRNKPFDRLFPAIWLDQFKDEVVCSLIFCPKDVRQHKRGFGPAPGRSPVRELLWRVLGKGTYWVPDAVKNAREDERLWKEMAALSWDDYDPPWRRSIIEQVVILGSALERWEAESRAPEYLRSTFWFGEQPAPAHHDAKILGPQNVPLQSQAKGAQLRSKLRRWLEQTAVKTEAQAFVKKDFLERAREEITGSITDNLFRDVWNVATIPKNFRKKGRRIGRN